MLLQLGMNALHKECRVDAVTYVEGTTVFVVDVGVFSVRAGAHGSGYRAGAVFIIMGSGQLRMLL